MSEIEDFNTEDLLKMLEIVAEGLKDGSHDKLSIPVDGAIMLIQAQQSKIEELEKQIESWSKLSKTQMEMLEDNINKNKQQESEIKDYRERLGLRV